MELRSIIKLSNESLRQVSTWRMNVLVTEDAGVLGFGL